MEMGGSFKDIIDKWLEGSWGALRILDLFNNIIATTLKKE